MSAQGVLRGHVGRTALARACSSVHEVRSIDLSCSTPAGVSANARPVCSSESETTTVLSIHVKHAASSQLRLLKWTLPEHAAESPLWGALCLLAARAAVSCSSTAAAKSGAHAVLTAVASLGAAADVLSESGCAAPDAAARCSCASRPCACLPVAYNYEGSGMKCSAPIASRSRRRRVPFVRATRKVLCVRAAARLATDCVHSHRHGMALHWIALDCAHAGSGRSAAALSSTAGRSGGSRAAAAAAAPTTGRSARRARPSFGCRRRRCTRRSLQRRSGDPWCAHLFAFARRRATLRAGMRTIRAL
jgi:hypothetical protein